MTPNPVRYCCTNFIQLFVSLLIFIQGIFNCINNMAHNDDKASLPILLGLQHQLSGYKSGVIEFRDESTVIVTAFQSEVLVCLLEVPSYMIPCELIQFFASVQDSILTLTIFRHYSDSSKYCGILCIDNAINAQRIIDDYNGQLMSSLDGCTHCELRQVTNITSEHSLELAMVMRGIQATDQWSGSDCSSDRLSVTAENTTFLNSSLLPQQQDHCPVCLEQLVNGRPQSFTTACGHTFHAACIERLENPQCPVCRSVHRMSKLYVN